MSIRNSRKNKAKSYFQAFLKKLEFDMDSLTLESIGNAGMRDQGVVRTIIGLSVLFLSLSLPDQKSVLILILCAVLPLLLAGLISYNFPSRRSNFQNTLTMLCIAVDMTSTAVVIHYLWPVGFLFSFMYLWSIVANGLRSGTRYLWIASIMAMVSIIIAGSTNPSLQEYPYIVGMILLQLVVVPLYLSNILTVHNVQSSIHKRLTNYAVTSTESQKRLFAEQIHNNVAQPLVALRAFVEMLDTIFDQEAKESSITNRRRRDTHILQCIENLKGLAHKTQEDTSEIIYKMWPALISMLGPETAIKQLVSDYKKEMPGVIIEYHSDIDVSNEYALTVHDISVYREIEEIIRYFIEYKEGIYSVGIYLRVDNSKNHDLVNLDISIVFTSSEELENAIQTIAWKSIFELITIYGDSVNQTRSTPTEFIVSIIHKNTFEEENERSSIA